MIKQGINQKQKTKWYRTWWAILLAIILALFVILGIITYGQPILDEVRSPTSQSKIEIKGSNAYANSRIEFYLNDKKVNETEANESGAFTSKINLKKEGENKIKATAINAKGKSKTSSEIIVVYDVTPPVLKVEKPKSPVEQEKIEIKGECEVKAEVKLLKGSKQAALINTENVETFSFTEIELAEGKNKFTLMAIDEAGNESKKENIQVVYNKPKEVKSSEEPKEKPEDAIRSIVSQQIENQDDIRKIDVTKQINGGWGVFVEYNASDNLTNNLIKVGIKKTSSNIYKALYTSTKNITASSVAAYFPMTDRYGNSEDGLIYKSILYKKEAKKVNWDYENQSYFRTEILPGIWTTSFIHPDLR